MEEARPSAERQPLYVQELWNDLAGSREIILISGLVSCHVLQRTATREGDPKGNSAVASKVAGSRARGMKHRVASWDREKFFFSSVHARRVSIHRLHPRVLRNDIRKSV